MKKIIKKTLVYLLSTVMCISSINIQAFAEEIVGNETSSEEKTDTISAGEIDDTVSENEIESIEPEIMEEVSKDNSWNGKTTEKVYENKDCQLHTC